MLHAIIIEDEQPAIASLVRVLHEVEPEIMIESTIRSVKEGVAYLSTPRNADIIFSDVQLSDGLSFDIFETTATEIPVVFVTGYDSFVMNSFDCNGIDYLLKPVTRSDLRKALTKFGKLGQHFAGRVPAPALPGRPVQDAPRRRSRIIVRRGAESVSLKLEHVVLFYSEHKVVYVVDKNGKKYMCDCNLSELEAQVDPLQFFRANRQYIINIEFVKGFRAYERVRLQVDVAIPENAHCVIVSQETAPLFRKWMFEG